MDITISERKCQKEHGRLCATEHRIIKKLKYMYLIYILYIFSNALIDNTVF